MTRAQVMPVDPVKLTVAAEAGALRGSDARYDKRLQDLAGVYRDAEAFERLLADDAGEPVYWVESLRREPGPGGLITGISVLEPGKVGDEFFMTRGHLHVQEDRSELYVGLTGHGVMLLETVEGRSEVVEVRRGEAVYVPGHWLHRSVNVGTERFATLFCFAADAGQDYEIIEHARGMRCLVVDDGAGWATRPNPDHAGYRA